MSGGRWRAWRRGPGLLVGSPAYCCLLLLPLRLPLLPTITLPSSQGGDDGLFLLNLVFYHAQRFGLRAPDGRAGALRVNVAVGGLDLPHALELPLQLRPQRLNVHPGQRSVSGDG